jgi:hypothetical protein
VRFSTGYPKPVLGMAVLLGTAALLAALVAGCRRLTAVQRLDGFVYLVVLAVALPPLAAASLSVAGDLGVVRPIAINLRYFGESAAIFTLLLAGAAVSLRPAPMAKGAALAVCLVFAVQLPYIYRYPFNDQDKVFRILDRNQPIDVAVSFPRSVESFLDSARRDEFRRRYAHVVLSSEGLEPALQTIGGHRRFVLFHVTTAEGMIQFPAFARHFDSAVKGQGNVKT